MVIVVDLYCRVSTDPQEDNTSLDEQEAAGRTYCEEHGLIIGMVHREVFSGYLYRERDKLSLLRERYREGTIHGVVIRTLDRLSRSQVHNAILMEEMEHHGITLHCVKEQIDDTPMGKFVRMVLAFVAEMEREKIMDRTVTGRINKAKEGKIVSGNKAPYGWQWVYDEQGNKTVALHAEQAPTLQWMSEQYADGTAAYNLASQLNERGIPSPDGVAWSDRTVTRLLFDTRITGKNAKQFAYQQRKTKQPLEPVDLPDGTYPAIISEELFARIQMRREMNKIGAIRANKEPERYLLRAGFVRCEWCQKPMMTTVHRGKHFYRCTKSKGHTNAILSEPLDARIWEWLQRLADYIDVIERAVALATSTNKIETDTAAIDNSIASWRQMAANYLKDLDNPTLVDESRTAILMRMNEANIMVAKLEGEKAQLKAGMIDKERERIAYEGILAWCRKVKEAREPLTYQQKRDFLHMLGAVVVVHNVKPYFENLVYHVELALPTIQELIPPALTNWQTSSPEDIEATKQLVAAGRILDIELVDHLIIGHQRFVSLKEHLRWE